MRYRSTWQMSGGDRGLLHSLARDYVATVVVQWLVLGTGLYLFHLVAVRGGAAGFAYYQVARGLVSALQPVVTLGLGPGLQRHLPHTTGTSTVRLARSAFGVEVLIVVLFVAGGAVLAPWTSRVLGLGGVAAAVAASILLAGTCLCTVAVAALRGAHRVTGANIVTVAGLGLVPPAAFGITDRIEEFLVVQGLGAAVVAAGGMVALRRPHPAAGPVGDDPGLGTLLRYGVHRLPGDLALPALFAYPTLAVAAVQPGGTGAGHVGLVTSAVTMICSFFGTLTPVMLPRLSRLFHGRARSTSTGRALTLLPVLAAVLATAAAGGIALLGPALVHAFLGPEFDGASAVLRIGVFAAVPLAMFYASRPTLDALPVPPDTGRLLVGCLALQVVLTHTAMTVLPPPKAAVLALAASAAVLGLCASRLVGRALRPAP